MRNRTKHLMWASAVVLLLACMAHTVPPANRAPPVTHTVTICIQGNDLIVDPAYLVVARADRVKWESCTTGQAPDDWEVDLGGDYPTHKRFYSPGDSIGRIRLTAKTDEYKYSVGAMRNQKSYFVDPELIVRP